MSVDQIKAEAWDEEVEFSCCSDVLGDECTLVTACGELDVHTCGDFRQAVEHARGQCGRLVIDLSDVTFMDSTALSVLVVLQRGMAKPLDVVVARPHLRKLLFITGLNTVFTLHRSLDEARGVGR